MAETELIQVRVRGRGAIPHFFHSLEEWQEKEALLGAEPEELEFSYVAGPYGELFKAMGIDAHTLPLWFEQVRGLKQPQRAALFFRRYTQGDSFVTALQEMGEVRILGGDPGDVMEELHLESGALDQVPEPFVRYIDWERMANDWMRERRLEIFRFEGILWVVFNQTEDE
ncbi:MAG: hypothetical protein HQL56_02840 [Magnetococcales bacterium]|nr:hypothetical protein [Magnetococcales bacterium]